MHFDNQNWQQIEEYLTRDDRVMVILGACEQHSTLSLLTDSKIPKVHKEAAKDDEITLIIQVNGKLRDRLMVSPSISESEAKAAALASENIQTILDGKEPRKVIYVPGRLVNIVI